MPAEWERMARDGDHYKLAFDQPSTWSQKYNLVWDDLLDLHLFPKSIVQTEWAFYAKHMERFGLPLDNRKAITKLDWEVWTATLTSDPAQFQDMIHRLVFWADNTPSRVPTTDYYDTISGKQMGFPGTLCCRRCFHQSIDGSGNYKTLAQQAIAITHFAIYPLRPE